MPNPLDDAYTAVWTLLEAKDDFLALFPSKTAHQQRSETTADRAPTEDLREPADAHFPICRVVMRQANAETQRNSTDSFLDVAYSVEVKTGQEQQSVLRDAAWAIFRAMLGWETYVKNIVTWNSKACIYDVDARAVEYGNQNTDDDSGRNQWVSLWSVLVRFQFTTTDLETL